MAITAAEVQDRRALSAQKVSTQKRVERKYSTLVIGASGAITSQSEFKDSGMLFTLTGSETGRYTVNVWQGYKSILAIGAMIVGPDDAALTSTDGIIVVARDIDVGAGANDGTFEVQFASNTNLADADITSGNSYKIWVDLEW